MCWFCRDCGAPVESAGACCRDCDSRAFEAWDAEEIRANEEAYKMAAERARFREA